MKAILFTFTLIVGTATAPVSAWFQHTGEPDPITDKILYSLIHRNPPENVLFEAPYVALTCPLENMAGFLSVDFGGLNYIGQTTGAPVTIVVRHGKFPAVEDTSWIAGPNSREVLKPLLFDSAWDIEVAVLVRDRSVFRYYKGNGEMLTMIVPPLAKSDLDWLERSCFGEGA